MNARFAVLTFAGAIVVAAAVSYWVGIQMGTKGLNETQRADAESVIKDYVAANPDLFKPAAPAPAESTLVDATAANPADYLSDGQRSQVEEVIKSYLIANPEIVRDAIAELQRKQDEAAQLAQQKAIDDNKALIFDSKREAVLGNPDGKVTLVEFFDYNCAYCRRAQADMAKLLQNDKDLRVVLKEFPVLGKGSVEAAKVSVAVHMTAPDQYRKFHDTLLGERGQVDGDRAMAVAEEIGLDKAKIEEAMKSDEVAATINEAYDLATKLSLTGTPSYVMSDAVIVGAVGYDTLKKKIDTIRAGCETTSC